MSVIFIYTFFISNVLVSSRDETERTKGNGRWLWTVSIGRAHLVRRTAMSERCVRAATGSGSELHHEDRTRQAVRWAHNWELIVSYLNLSKFLYFKINFTKQFVTFHFINEVNCEKQFSPRWDSNPRSPAFAASIFPLNHKGLTVENKQHKG